MPMKGDDLLKNRIERVAFPSMSRPKILRTAAYCRVSSDKDSMRHSLSAQISYYNALIQKNPDALYKTSGE